MPERWATTVLTTPTAWASGSMTSSIGMIACLCGMVTDSPAQTGPSCAPARREPTRAASSPGATWSAS